jgi:hypothetical protein
MRHNYKSSSQAVPLGKILSLSLSPLPMLLGEMLTEKSIGMIAGPRGGGKSLLAMLIAYAVSGEKLLEPWGSGCGAITCYLDGEMRIRSFQERLALLHARNKDSTSIAKVEQQLHVVSRDYCSNPIGSIDTEEGQQRIDEMIPSETRLIIVDNLSAWTGGGREDSNSWAVIKTWLIEKRLRGQAVLLIHHTGKNGQQRGSSAHEDLLDYSILLSPLPPSNDREDTRFLVEHKKLRDHIPSLKQSFEYAIWTENDALHFSCHPQLENTSELMQEIVNKHLQGMNQVDIAAAIGKHKSTVSRMLAAFKRMQANSGDEAAGEVA